MNKIINAFKFVWSIFIEIGGLKVRTKIFLVVVFFGVISFILYGCTSVDKAYIVSNYKNGMEAIQDHIVYIREDTELSDLDKKVRINSLEEWLKSIKIKYDRKVLNE